MNQDKKAIVEKIRKLLALANSSNENEAQLATEHATKLLTKHNLKMQDVEGYSREYIKAQHRTTKTKATPHDRFVFDIVMRFFFVETIRGYIYNRDLGRIVIYHTFVGEDHNVEIAQYVHAFLDRLFPQAFKDYRKRTGAPLTHRKSYYAGLWQSISKKLEETRHKAEQEAGLVLVKDPGIGEFIQNEFALAKTPKSEKTQINSTSALQAGLEDGKDVNIAMGLGSGSSPSDKIEGKLALAGSH